MKDQLITFETAKLAKENGFDEYCDYSYEASNCYKTFKPWKNSEDPTEYAVSTQSLLQSWLRENHNIHIDIKWLDDVFNYYFVITTMLDNTESDNSKSYKTYEEALEDALIESLKLITI